MTNKSLLGWNTSSKRGKCGPSWKTTISISEMGIDF